MNGADSSGVTVITYGITYVGVLHASHEIGVPYRDSSLQEIFPYLLYDGTRHTSTLQTYDNLPHSFYLCSTVYAHLPEPNGRSHMVGLLTCFLNL